ncbi:hypothetical protein [Halopiger goleimassiliensis]|uniref:hypothetical protein n=1 Tax=Halopiger goleimassiliensis TaxID=1293048 RepID=UPI000AF70168|nr:hypothetical protein [Halopiger goleimassiliensis]
MGEAVGNDLTGTLASSDLVAIYQSLGPVERAIGQFVATLIVAAVLLGLVQGAGTRAVEKSRRSPVISICIGTPGVFVLSALGTAGYLILDSSLGLFFGMLFLLVSAAVLPAGLVIGVVGIGTGIGARLGRDGLPAGVVVGSILAGLVGVSIPATAGFGVIAAALGTGALARVLFGGGNVSSPDDRTVPPANKI